MRKITVAALLALTLAPMQSYAATTEHFAFSGVEADANGAFVLDAFRQGFFSITATASRTTHLSQPATNTMAFVYLNIFDYCNNVGTFEFGSANGIQFSAQTPANGNNIPRSVTASGTLTMLDVNGIATDVLTFQLSLKPIGVVSSGTSISHEIFSLDSKRSLVFDNHSDGDVSDATGSANI